MSGSFCVPRTKNVGEKLLSLGQELDLSNLAVGSSVWQ